MLNARKIVQSKKHLSKSLTLTPSFGPSAKKSLCNICKRPFKPHTRFELFCEHCKSASETYRFADWLLA